MNDEKLNLEIEKIANLMVHDDVSSDEQDVTKLEKYKAKLDASWIDGQHIYMIINNKLSISYNHLITMLYTENPSRKTAELIIR